MESKQEVTSGWNFTKCIPEVKVNQLQVKSMHVRMGISTFKAVCCEIGPALGKTDSTDFVRMSKKDAFSW